jgi:hypothetical protein
MDDAPPEKIFPGQMPKRAIFGLYLRPCLNDTTVNNGKWTKYDGFSTIFDVFFPKRAYL